MSRRLYRPAAYYAAKITATAPFSLLSALVFCGITYGMAGLRDTPLAIVENAVINCILSLIAIQVGGGARAVNKRLRGIASVANTHDSTHKPPDAALGRELRVKHALRGVS